MRSLASFSVYAALKFLLLFGVSIALGMQAHLSATPHSLLTEDYLWKIESQAQLSKEGSAVLIANKDPRQVWTSGLVLAEKSLDSGTSYELEFQYRFLGENASAGFGYCLVRSAALAPSGDQWERFSLTDGEVGTVVFQFRTTHVSDASITIGLNSVGSVEISNLKLSVKAPDWLELPTDMDWQDASFDASKVKGCPEFDVELPQNETKEIISLASYLEGGATAFTALKNALDDCKKKDAGKLIIPKGVYAFSEGIPIEVNAFTDFEIDGQHSEFVFSGNENRESDEYAFHAMVFQNNVRFKMKNLQIRWDTRHRPLASLGKVYKVSKDARELWVNMYWPDHRDYDVSTLHMRGMHLLSGEFPHA